MVRKPHLCSSAARFITAENGPTLESGTALANYTSTLSCDRTLPHDGQPRTWGGARNRANRVSDGLTDRQVADLLSAGKYAMNTGRIFQRHWTVHYGLAGIEPSDGARFVSRLLDLVAKQAQREGGRMTALWVRERASGKGEHVHILLHLPAGMRLQGRTRRWIEAAGGRWRRGVSKVRTVGRALAKVEGNSKTHRIANAANVVRYMLKAASVQTGERLALTKAGRGGSIVGKRCGWTQNIGKAARGRGRLET